MNPRIAALAVLIVASLVAALSLDPIPQDPAYHQFADRRAMLGIPNFFDVASNLPFLLIGIAGIRFCASGRMLGARVEWTVFFAGVTLVAIGSGYYHWAPTSETLAWDRAPMTVAFMGLLAALIGESIGPKTGRVVLWPLIVIGIASVVHWHATDDLRLYAWVQFFPLLLIPVLLVAFPARFTHRWVLLAGLGLYGLSKVSEACDVVLFESTEGVVGGHAVKHLLAAGACLTLLWMLRKRTQAKG